MPKTSHEKAEIRRQTEARHQQDKDRSGHEHLRGKKMPTLSDLSREMPSSEVVANFLNIVAEDPSDRSAAIMAAGYLEQALFTAITTRIVYPGPTDLNSWFESANAPFGTFAAKIKLGRALATYGPETEERLCRIKDIRNVFAHRSSPIDFSHPTLVKEVRKLVANPMPTPKSGVNPARVRYCSTCFKLGQVLLEQATEHQGKELTVPLP